MSLMLRIGVAVNEVQTGLARVEGMVGRFGGRLTGALAGAVGVGAFGAMIKQSIEMAGRLEDLSERFDAPVQGLQILGNVAKEKGSDIEAVGQAMKFLGKNAQLAAREGTGDLVKAFEAIGVTGQQLTTLRPDELFLKLSDAFKAGRLTGQEFAVTAKLLGRGFEQLIPVIRLGSDEIRKLGSSKGIFSEQEVRRLAAVEDFLQKISNLTKVLAGRATFKFMESFNEFLKQAPKGGPLAELQQILFGGPKAPAGRRSGGSKITELGSGLSEQEIKDQDRRDREFVQFRVKLIDAEIEGREKAKQILEGYEERTAEERIRRAEERARATADAISQIEDIRAERAGPQAEFDLLKRRAQESADLARQTGSVQDTLVAERAAQTLQNALQRSFEQGGFGDAAAARARDVTQGLVGSLPNQALRDIAMQNVNQDPPRNATVAAILQTLPQVVNRLDLLIRQAGTFVP